MKVDGVPPVLFPHQYRSTPKSGEFTLDLSKVNKAPDEKQKHSEKDRDNSKELQYAVEQLNKLMYAYNTEISFHVHEDSGEYVVKVINSVDKTVIREIPPERVLDIVAYFKKAIGIIIDELI